jgi:hypothetical protein
MEKGSHQKTSIGILFQVWERGYRRRNINLKLDRLEKKENKINNWIQFLHSNWNRLMIKLFLFNCELL